MAIARSSNGPTIVNNDGVFILNPFTLFVDCADEVVIEAPVTAVVLFSGVPQPSITVTPIVTGRTIAASMTTAQLAQLPKKNASLNILFNGEYVIQTPLVPTFVGSAPATVTASYESPALGVFRVSFYHGQTQASLTEADRIACEAARDYIDDAVQQINDRVPGFLDDLAATIMAGHDASYTSLAGGPTGGLSSSNGTNGCTVNATTRVFSIAAGSSGAGSPTTSYMRRDYDLLSTDNLRVNDLINIRCVVSQTVDGAISDSVIGIRVYTSAGVSVPLSTTPPAVYDSATKTFTFDAQFTVANVSTTYYIELYIKPGAPNQTSAVDIRWLDFGINQNKYLYEDSIDLIDTAVRAYQKIAVTFDDQPIVTAIDMSGVTDVTTALQAEINLAISTSGKWRGRQGTPRITSSIALSGRIDMDFAGMDLNANIATLAPTAGAEAFVIVTASPVALRNGIIRRAAANAAQQPTPVRFSASFINKDSVFERMQSQNIPRGWTIDYCDNLTMVGCTAGGGQFYGLRAGANSPASMTNLKLTGNFFEGYLSNHAQIYNAEGLLVEKNIFRSASTTTVPARSLEIIPSGTGQQKGGRILHNQFLSFTEYGLSASPVSGVTLRDFMVFGNFFDDRTPDSTDASSRPMHFAGISKNIDMLTVMANDVFCKEIGLRADNAKVAKFIFNNFYKSNVGGAYASSQGMLGSNLEFSSYGNFIDPNLGVATNKTGWGTEYTTQII